jgi:hypothetical protein
LWNCRDIAEQLVSAGVVKSIGRETVRKMLRKNRLKPWRFAMWLSAKVPRDEAFACCVREIMGLYTRPLLSSEMVLSMDEKTSLQPRPRKAKTLPCRPGQPTRVEHEYGRDGALNLFAALDTRTGRVFGQTYQRKRQVEMIAFLEHLNAEMPASVTTVRIVLDNVSTHVGKEVRKWLARHPRFVTTRRCIAPG